MKKTLLSSLIAILVTVAAMAQTGQRSYELRNGSWFNGQDFTNVTWYISNGVLSKKAPAKIDTVIDLAGRWVVPPMGDAFCSSVADNPSAANMLKMYRDEGVFYLQILGNTQEGRTAIQADINKPSTPDVIFANGAITCSLGYPFMQYEGPAQGIRNPNLWAANYEKLKTGNKMLGNGYWFIDNKTALSANWDKIKAQKPGVISIYLLDAGNNGGKEGKGLSEDMAKAVIKKAHKADLKVWAHVETLEDVRLGIKLGVDGFANLPGYNWDGTGEVSKIELTEADIKAIVKKKIAVATLFAHAQTAAPRPTVLQFHARTLKNLFDNNAMVVIGSDDQQRTIRTELNYWFNLGTLDNKKILKCLCEDTPRAIYPSRKIGKLEDGYEASFLVLNDNPLSNVLKIRAVSFKFKNGVLMPATH